MNDAATTTDWVELVERLSERGWSFAIVSLGAFTAARATGVRVVATRGMEELVFEGESVAEIAPMLEEAARALG